MRLYEEDLVQLSLSDPEPGGEIIQPAEYKTAIMGPTTRQKIYTTKECRVCFEHKHTDFFPQTAIGSDCICLSQACVMCLQEHIKVQMSSKEWKEGSITCPMCNRALQYQEIEDYADGETFAM